MYPSSHQNSATLDNPAFASDFLLEQEWLTPWTPRVIALVDMENSSVEIFGIQGSVASELNPSTVYIERAEQGLEANAVYHVDGRELDHEGFKQWLTELCSDYELHAVHFSDLPTLTQHGLHFQQEEEARINAYLSQVSKAVKGLDEAKRKSPSLLSM
jgi:hypothetical protein